MLNKWDVDQWLKGFAKAKKMLDEENLDRKFLKRRMNDGIYLATLVEFLMTLEEPDGVLEVAKERQTERSE